ncbi:copper chaperone PCu(A)C [Qipengyuania soli]|uniref:Copper chaperone PCu(A)C n=1 Tax=Qipengyuania soli TaxID=2782568 RepID=A0A7S8F6G9_9SPHN|nr:copper chaperone PCu(A)C [Qipengyuania soli]QPD00001.1 copper chaperone PCu(A)C [Qipengyuania soli]
MNFARFAGLALLAAALPLAGCTGGNAPSETSADKSETGLEVTDARLVLPAVSGNPGAVYFNVENKGDRNVAIRSASVKGASSAMMHEMAEWDGEMVMGEMGPPMLQPGDKVSFEPGGKHVMAFDLDSSLVAGGKTELTLTIAGGKSVTAEADIKGPGDER